MTGVVARVSSADLRRLAADVRAHASDHRSLGVRDIVAFLDAFAARLSRSPEALGVEGAAFLCLWMRRAHLESLLEGLPGGMAAFDGGFDGRGRRVRAHPVGLVCHWTAGNVPTVALFSWALALLTCNVSIIRVSEEALASVEALVPVLAASATESIAGARLLEGVRFIHFDREDRDAHAEMSMLADCKIVWGGQTAVSAISALARPQHCNEIVFGPKYSLGVIDRAVLADRVSAADCIRAFVRDVLAFEQAACTSPQTIFFEPSGLNAEAVRDAFAHELERSARARPKAQIDFFTASQIYAARTAWGLTEGKSFRGSRGADWTVCLDSTLELKEAVQSRTLFLVEVADAMAVADLVTPRVQTIGLAMPAGARALEFAERAGVRGATRIVRPGNMNLYDLPWDGRMPLSELVRWVSVSL